MCDVQRAGHQRKNQKKYYKFNGTGRNVKLWNLKTEKIIAEVLNVDEEEITMDTTFVDDLGADSLDIFQIIMGIEEEFDIEIANEDAEHIVTVADAVEQIKNALN